VCSSGPRATLYVVDTISQGVASEAAILGALTLKGLPVLMPFGGGLPFDLGVVIPPDGRILRVQVKTGRVRNDCVIFNACSTDHGSGRQDYRGRADVIAVHVPSLGRIFIVPVDDCPSFTGVLRLVPTRNNQRSGVRYADDYDLANWAESLAKTAVVATADP
jgi:hypothetical protein